MLLPISGVLDTGALEQAYFQIETLAWKDGRGTAGAVASAVKRNLQADLSSRTGVKLRDHLLKAIQGHPVFSAAARPCRLSKLLISKTGIDGAYGVHIDNPFMGTGDHRLRTDLSFTLFLSDPETYEGGELSIEHAGLTQRLKLPAGDLVLYPSTALHEVQPVTAGERIACVGWVQSSVRDPEIRELLFDLENLRATLLARFDPQSAEMLYLSKSIANLMRKFGD